MRGATNVRWVHAVSRRTRPDVQREGARWMCKPKHKRDGCGEAGLCARRHHGKGDSGRRTGFFVIVEPGFE